MFKWFRWQLAKYRLAARSTKPQTAQLKLTAAVEGGTGEALPLNAKADGPLAAQWDEYASSLAPGYSSFLESARDYYKSPIDCVLDLGCGTGLLTRQVARFAQLVVGLDIKKDMLQKARLRTEESNVRYEEGDFRGFSLPELFDAAVCGSESLNYLNTPGELVDVFRCVRHHLRPGGLFAFDVVDQTHFALMTDFKVLVEGTAERFEVSYVYDPVARVSESRVVFEDAVEQYRRIPIEEADVFWASTKAGLEPLEHFSRETYNPFSNRVSQQFYLLRAPLR